MTAIEFGKPLATRLVPSTGSTAMSTANPPRPSSSPMKSIGASSRSPSPMTMRPSMSIWLSVSRIASTAAPSAMSRSPRPIQREAAKAAASVTLTKSSVSTGIRADCVCIPASYPSAGPPHAGTPPSGAPRRMRRESRVCRERRAFPAPSNSSTRPAGRPSSRSPAPASARASSRWYAYLTHGPHRRAAARSDACCSRSSLGPLRARSALWDAYARYFAHRTDISYARRAALGRALVGGARPAVDDPRARPAGLSTQGRAIALAVALFCVVKLLVAARFNATVRDVLRDLRRHAHPDHHHRRARGGDRRTTRRRPLRRLEQPAAGRVGPLGRRALHRHRDQRLLRNRTGVLPALPAADLVRRRAHRQPSASPAC